MSIANVPAAMSDSSSAIVMDVKEIREYLPHRYPFLLVDRVVELKLGESIVAYKNITINEGIFQGHFPEIPIFPGVLIVEAMAQAAGILGFKTMGKKPQDGSIYYFVGCDEIRFKRPVVPGDRLQLEARILSEKRGIWKFAVRASVGAELASEGVILCADRKV